MDEIYTPQDEITTIPPGWNGEDTITDYLYDSFDFLNDPREDIYSLEDGE